MASFIGGALMGAAAHGILLLALVPVLRHAREASLAKGIIAVAASFALLSLGAAAAALLARDLLLLFLAGELVAFLAGWIILACVQIAHRSS